MNWNAVIKSLQEEALRVSEQAEALQKSNLNPAFTAACLLQMELCTILAKALAEGMKDNALDK